MTSRLLVNPGGRSSVSGVTATVFGASGFMGRYVVDRLGRIGSQVVVPFRDDGMEIRHLRVCGDVGQVVAVPFHLRDRDSINEAISRSNVVINLIGRHYQTRNFSLEDVNVTGPALLAKAAKESGVKRFVHLSALNASTDSTSPFLRSKARGEEAVLEQFPEAIIIRPAVTFGWEDRFLIRFVQLSASLPFVPLVNNGRQKVQPVFVENVADAILSCLNRVEALGQTYHLGGPDVISIRTVTDMIAELTRRRNNFVDSPKWLALATASMMEMSPWPPLLTKDEVHRMMNDCLVPDDGRNLESLDISPISIYSKAKLFLGAFRSGGRAFPETSPY